MNLKKVLLICIGASLLSIGFMALVDNYLLAYLRDLIMEVSGKYLIYQFTFIDRILIRFFPLIIAGVMMFKVPKDIKPVLKMILSTFLLLLIMIVLGIFIASTTWTNLGEESSLLPEYYIYQPVNYYWTIFIALGMMVPIGFYLKKV